MIAMRLRQIILDGLRLDDDKEGRAWLPLFDPPLESTDAEPLVLEIRRGGRVVFRCRFAGQQ